MLRSQYIVVSVAIVTLLGLYFGVPTRSSVKTAAAAMSAHRPNSAPIATMAAEDLIRSAKEKLDSTQRTSIGKLEPLAAAANTNETKVAAFKKLSSAWNAVPNFAVGGLYAEKVAEVSATDSAWSITGTTYLLAMRTTEDDGIRQFCNERAINAFQSAISLKGTDVGHRINLALCYVEGGKEPMKGIAMLTQLAKDYPQNENVFITLGKLSLRTGQFDKALGRFQAALAIAPKNGELYCLTAQAYEGLQNENEARTAYQNCAKYTKDKSLRTKVEAMLKSK